MVKTSDLSSLGLQFLRFSRLLKAATILTFVIISFGSLVRAASAGLACPDWPLCFGQLVPAFDYQVFLEWFHRLLAGGLSILLIYALTMLLRSSTLRSAFGLQLFVALVLLGIQVVLGGLTVLKLLDAKTVAAHLINALLFMSVLVWMSIRSQQFAKTYLAVDQNKRESQHSIHLQPQSFDLKRALQRFKRLAAVFWGFVFVQIAIGGMVSTNYAGLACPDFPKCHGQWIPPLNFHLWLQVIHRMVGVGVAFFSIFVAFAGWSSVNKYVASFRLHFGEDYTLNDVFKRVIFIKRVVCIIPFMICLQIVLGVINVFYFLPTSITVLHLAHGVAIYVLALMVVIYLFEPVFSNEWKMVSLTHVRMFTTPTTTVGTSGTRGAGVIQESPTDYIPHPNHQG